MLTPNFELAQDDKFVKAIIYAPFAKISETEIEFDGKEFLFSSKPYFLRLYLPDEVIENGEESANYDADTKKFTINMPKKETGKYFLGLDMITQLLTPTGKTHARRLVEELPGELEEGNEEENEEDETRWLAEQVLPSPSSVILDAKETHGYGFANRQHGVFTSLREEISEIVDIKNPDEMSILQRRQMAMEMENDKFSDDHYLADHYQDEEIKLLIDQNFFWNANKSGASENQISFTMDERDRLKNLPKTQIKLKENEADLAMNSLIDIIFAYAYDYRTTDGEHNVESGWTISKLSATLSCMISWNESKEAIIASIRRSLCFPLFRNWKLSLRVLDDVQLIFDGGKSMILKCLVDIHRIFASDSDYRYIFNDLYITDYCLWIQGLQDSFIAKYATAIKNVAHTIKKIEVGLNLDELELAASMAMFECDQNGLERSRKLDSDDEEESDNVMQGVQDSLKTLTI